MDLYHLVKLEWQIISWTLDAVNLFHSRIPNIIHAKKRIDSVNDNILVLEFTSSV